MVACVVTVVHDRYTVATYVRMFTLKAMLQSLLTIIIITIIIIT